MGYKNKCKSCGKHKLLTDKGFCIDCAVVPIGKAITQMRKKKGPIHRKWKQRLKEGLDKPEIARRKHQAERSYPEPKLTRVRAIPINIKQCPSCLAFNKATAKKCQICKILFA